MRPDRKRLFLRVGAAAVFGIAWATAWADRRGAPPEVGLDVPIDGPPPSVYKAMLKLANVGKDDVLYDLGCGDGRVVIMAVKEFGAKKGVGIDIDPERIKECKENAQYSGVTDKVVWQNANFFDVSLKEASVVTAYLLPNINLMVRPMLYRDLKPGSRVVTMRFHMGDWEHDQLLRHKRATSHPIYIYIIPASVGGTWEWTMKDMRCRAALEQEFQFFKGTVTIGAGEPARITGQSLKGAEIAFSAAVKVDGKDAKATYRGTVEGDTIKGTQEIGGARQDWTATRKPVDVTGTWQVTVLPAEKKLNGVLTIEKKADGVLTATYALDADKKPIPIGGLYVWGPCVRFEIPTGAASVDFKGVLTEGTGKGVVDCEGWTTEPTWTARRVTEGKGGQP